MVLGPSGVTSLRGIQRFSRISIMSWKNYKFIFTATETRERLFWIYNNNQIGVPVVEILS